MKQWTEPKSSYKNQRHFKLRSAWYLRHFHMQAAGCSSTRISGGNPSLSSHVSCLVNCAHCEVCSVTGRCRCSEGAHSNGDSNYQSIGWHSADTRMPSSSLLSLTSHKLSAVLGLHTAWNGSSPTFRDNISVPSSGVKQSKTDHRWQYNTAHALCVLGN